MRLRHALTSRTVRGWWLAAALVCGVQVAHAAYQNAAPPPGFSGSPGAWAYKPGSAEKWLARTAETRTTVNVGGRTVTMNALLRMSATAAPRFAAAAVWTPVGRAAAIGIAMTALATQLLEQGIQWSEERQRWEKMEDGVYWVIFEGQPEEFRSLSPYATCAGAFSGSSFSGAPGANFTVYGVTQDSGTCQFKQYEAQVYGNFLMSRRQEAPQPKAVPLDEFKEAAAPYITPDAVPDLAPDQPIPVELPILNPSDEPEPKSRPLRVPLGNPQPNPQPEGAPVPAPYPWRQPVVDITPSPTQTEPWRVDSTPKDILLPTPHGIEEPTPQPPADPETPPPTNEAPPEPGLCAMYPDILACARPELDTPEQEIPKQTRELTYTELALFGSGSCPADKTSTVGGQIMTVWEWGPKCDLISTYVRPIFIAAAAFAALLILTPSRGES